jgi:predicted PurR-regulated permease PerM
MAQPKEDLARTVISTLGLCGLILAVFWILRPFLTAVIWATLLAVATWPLLLRIERILWKRRGLAVAVMAFLLLGVALLPFLAAVMTLVTYGDAIGQFASGIPGYHIPQPPTFLGRLPLVGDPAREVWEKLAAEGTPGLIRRISPYLGMVAKWFAAQVGNFGVLVAQFFVTLIVTVVFYSSGEEVVGGVRAFFRRLMGSRGDDLVSIAGGAIRSVAMGVVVTALAQSVLGGIGLAVAGVPFSGPLGAAMFLLCIAQIGPSLVLIPAIVWAYSVEGAGWGTLLLAWSVPVIFLDTLIRPVLIRMGGSKLPLLLIFAGVLGGLMSLGLIGIFVGPVILAVAHALLNAWLDWDGAPGERTAGP